MRVPRIYQDCHIKVNETLSLDERALKHVVQVLRMEKDRELILFNGAGGEYRARLSQVTKREAIVDVLEFINIDRESSFNIHLAQCVSKGDRFEFALQKAVELGVKSITPVFSKRSQLKITHERKDKKLSHWYKIMLSACEQSARTTLVSINDPISFPDFIFEHDASTKIILHPEASKPFSSIHASGDYTLLVGPEGGFEDEEVELAEKSGFQAIKLGKKILRTETAPVAAIAALNFLEKEF